MLVQAFVPEAPAEAFNVGIFDELAKTDEVQFHIPAISPTHSALGSSNSRPRSIVIARRRLCQIGRDPGVLRLSIVESSVRDPALAAQILGLRPWLGPIRHPNRLFLSVSLRCRFQYPPSGCVTDRQESPAQLHRHDVLTTTPLNY